MVFVVYNNKEHSIYAIYEDESEAIEIIHSLNEVSNNLDNEILDISLYKSKESDELSDLKKDNEDLLNKLEENEIKSNDLDKYMKRYLIVYFIITIIMMLILLLRIYIITHHICFAKSYMT